MTASIRDEHEADISAIHALTELAFSKAPHASGTEQDIVNALRRCEALTISLVAEVDNTVVGHVAVSPVTISNSSTDSAVDAWYGLGPISVLPDHQKMGIGSNLMNAAINRLNELNANGCVLLGDPNYYTRFGFKPLPQLVLADVPPEYFQTLLIKGPMPSGAVSYHPAFSI